MGAGILVVYGCVVFFLSLQFGVLSFFFNRGKEEILSLKNCFGVAGCWVLLEASRLFLFSGFPWNPAGLALASSKTGVQFAAIFGVYGLSFWVIFVNAFALYSLSSWKKGAVWVLLACAPYTYGIIQGAYFQHHNSTQRTVSVALVQTGILPEEKDPFLGAIKSYIPPLNQWERIWGVIPNTKKLDLILLPEAAVARGATDPVYPLELVAKVWENYFGKPNSFPKLEAPFAYYFEGQGWRVTNLFLTQALANHFDARTIAGFTEREGGKEYNAAYDFSPQGKTVSRYEKRVLVPMGEYVPFKENAWVANFLADQFGVADSFCAGIDAKVFGSVFPIGISICAEETYSHMIRDLRLKGAELFVNLTNDIWFPGTHLPQTHLQHGCIRSAENGVPSLRSCNSGITAYVDCCGRVIGALDPSEKDPSVLTVDVPLCSFRTLYTFWGDSAILLLSGLFFLFSFLPSKINLSFMEKAN